MTNNWAACPGGVRALRTVMLLAAALPLFADSAAIGFIRHPGRIEITINGQPFSNFYYGREWPQPFLHPLRAANGVAITRGYPVEKIEGESQDHVWHHGLWYAHGDINGVDFWRDKGPDVTGRIVAAGEPAAAGDTVTGLFRLIAPGGKELGEIEQSFRFKVWGETRIADVRVTLRAPKDHPLRFGDTEEGALGLRFRDEFREDRGAVITNSNGLTGTKQVWGQRAEWVDYTTTVAGRQLGVTLFDHPANPKYPTFWHARGYGLCAANPFGEHDFMKDKSRDGSYTIPAAASAVFRYRVAIHPGPLAASLASRLAADFAAPEILDRAQFRHYIDDFNSHPTPDVVSYIPDERAWPWLVENIPFLHCPDPDVERTWYYRWWAYRKHIRQTPAGFVITEFLRPVKHATEYNAISSALGHHIAEGRWLRDPRYTGQDLDFWLRSGDGGGLQRHYHQYSNWTAAAVYERFLAGGCKREVTGLLDPLLLDYAAWERDRLLPSGLFWQYDVRDAMEESISGGRKARNARPSINSYMYGNAVAISRIARLAGKPAIAARFEEKAATLKTLVEERLWNPKQQFFETLLESGSFASVREAIGYTPWLFDLPSPGRGFEAAWKQLMDPEGFFAPFGPTTAERRHPAFAIAESGDDCQWNGPSWPFATTITLKALANVLNGRAQTAITASDYFKTFLIYARSQQLTLPDGSRMAFVDENLNPFTGEWHARARKIKKGTFNGRGDHYNHSGFADLVITGVAGLRPRADDVVEVNPLLPAGAWPWFCLEGVPYHGQSLTILWDQDGQKFGRGRGLNVFAGGRLIAQSATLARVTGRLP